MKMTYQQYGGIIQDLDFDPGRWAWSGRLGLLHSYSAKKGRTQLLQPRLSFEKPIATKWRDILPASFNPCWQEVWLIRRPQKEADFLWSVYHCAIAVNAWWKQINDQIAIACQCCDTSEP